MTSRPHQAAPTHPVPLDSRIWQVISASAVGTMIEWYDFYIFGSLASVISPLFYPAGNASSGIAFCTMSTTASDTNRPSVAVIWMKLV